MFARAPENYLQIKPILQQKSFGDMNELQAADGDDGDLWSSYKPVYKQPTLPSFRTCSDVSNGSVPSRSYEYINLLRNGSASDDNSASTSSKCEYTFGILVSFKTNKITHESS